MNILLPSGRVVGRLIPVSVLAAALSACGGGGGGGGNVVINPPPTTTPSVPAPVVGTVSPNLAVAYDVTNVAAARAAGFTGAGVTIGVVDSGVTRNNPALYPRVIANLNYVSSSNDLSVDDKVGHGTAVSLSMAGLPWGNWPGGVATGSNIVSARIIQDERPTDDGSGQGNEVNGALGLASIHDDLIARGARIMNNSWGGLYWTNLNATAPIASEYRRFIINNDGLVVFATGNESRSTPTDMSSLPSKPGPDGSMPAADLERGWIAVAALASGKIAGTDTYMTKDEVLANPSLASYSNACGVAMRYCLVAPGDVVVPGKDDPYNAPQYWRYSGTSLAAPQVSGAAALVWQAFPWFNNDQVRQTILGTARDLGAPGIDAVFGNGLLDVGKAVKGPSRLDFGAFTANNSTTATFANDLSGAGSLIKNGAGVLNLTGKNTYTGITQINAGSLALHNNGVGGSLYNTATLNLIGAGGHTVGGDYSQTSNATLSYLVGAPLMVEGSATLAGTLNVAGKVTGYINKAQETVVNARGGLNGQFGALTQSPGVFLQGSLSYDANNAFLNITSLSVSATAQALGFTPAAVSAAERVQGGFDGIDGGTVPGSGFVSGGGAIQRVSTYSAAEFSLASLNGELLTSDLAFVRMAIDGSQRRLDRRLDALTDPSARTGSWSSQGGGTMSATSGMGLNSNGWRFGQDWRFAGGNALMGVALAEERGSAFSTLRSDRSRSRNVDASLYGLWSLPGDWFVSGVMGMGQLDQSGNRLVALGDYGFEVANGLTDRYRRSSVQFGRRWQLGDSSSYLTPYAGMQQLSLTRGGFAEQGALGFGLQAPGSRLGASHGLIGLRLSSRWGANNDWSLFGYAEHQRLLSSVGVDRMASFTGFDLASPIMGYSLAPSAQVLRGGLSHRGFSLSFDGRREQGTLYKQASVAYRRGF